ncbi:CLUMA_CG000113, isoform A [Clunio marinus]|uniref:CLUMA_CG000113, isoform A n=1 Tax=Clunio marinus TaxID=568069 RepID=A0A1J1HJH8_9DIPT|nr:CLUMA_CG000113, isoform A [Clunio marinus]
MTTHTVRVEPTPFSPQTHPSVVITICLSSLSFHNFKFSNSDIYVVNESYGKRERKIKQLNEENRTSGLTKIESPEGVGETKGIQI